jgi:ABC-type iron transport system FetAB permease component
MIDLVIFAQFTVSHSELCNLEKLLIMQSPPAVWRLFVIGCGFSFHDLFAADAVIRSLLIFGSIVSVRDLFSTSLRGDVVVLGMCRVRFR